jgi:PAS domain S-box-containing protein
VDVQADSGFAPHRRIAASAGFRAVQSTPLFSRSGEPLGMLSTHFRRPHRPSERELRLTDLYAAQAAEMIEMKRTEQALRASETSLVEGQRISQTGSWNWNVDSGKIVGSLELRRIFGFESEAAQPPYSRYVERVHPDDRTSVEQTVDAAVHAGDSFRIDYRIVLPDGAVKYLHGVGHPVAKGPSDRPEYVGTVMDVTERKRAEEALRKAQDELAHVTRVTTLGELAASIAHEVNQPLAAVVANANASLRWLAAVPSDIQEARDGLQRIVRDANRASEVVSRIRAFLKRGESRRDRLDVEDVIREVIGLVQGEVRTQGVSVLLESAAHLPAVTADRVQLQQVILNLVMNAIEAMTPITDRPRLLEVKADTYRQDAILVAVRDSGVGFDPQRRERIFDAFYSTKPHGMGMGLAISRSIVEAHGGRLWATPNDGYGETFQLTLPVDRVQAEPTI